MYISKWKKFLWKGYMIQLYQLYHILENTNYADSKQISGCQRFLGGGVLNM